MNIERRVIAGHSVRWDQERADSYYSQGHWVEHTLQQTLETEAARDSERVLIEEGHTRLTAGDLQERAAILAGVLAQRFPAGSVISFMLPNWHEAAIIYLATTISGMVTHPILPSLREQDLGFVLADVASRLIFAPAEFRGHHTADMVAAVSDSLQDGPEVIVVRGPPDLPRSFESLCLSATAHDIPPPDSDAVRMIMYTSGTTGSPKGVMHSHNSLHALIRQIGTHWLIEPGDRFLVASPISHIGGSIYTFECPLLLGSSANLMERWDADAAIELLISKRCTHFAGATPFLVQILAAARERGTRLPDLKLFICGGASVPPSLIRDAADYFDRAIVTRVYGSTEVPVTTVGVTDATRADLAAETDGRIGVAQVKLDRQDANPAPAGEILARGPQMLVGYVHPEDEAGVFDDQGYYRSGDTGHVVESDHLVISGRLKDIIIRNGENIAPKEIEDILVQHPEIDEVAIIGLPDTRTGERACAVIVPTKGQAPDLDAIGEYLHAQGLAKFKFPEQIVVQAALPKNDAGKVLKHQLRSSLQ